MLVSLIAVAAGNDYTSDITGFALLKSDAV